MERVLWKGEVERKRLEAAASLLQAYSKNGFIYHVENVYLDFGQDWMWTTIVCYGNDSSWQVLSPREWTEITSAATMEQLVSEVVNMTHDRFFLDR